MHLGACKLVQWMFNLRILKELIAACGHLSPGTVGWNWSENLEVAENLLTTHSWGRGCSRAGRRAQPRQLPRGERRLWRSGWHIWKRRWWQLTIAMRTWNWYVLELKYMWNGGFPWLAFHNCIFLEPGNQVPTNCVCDPERMALTSKNYEKGRELCLLFELEWTQYTSFLCILQCWTDIQLQTLFLIGGLDKHLPTTLTYSLWWWWWWRWKGMVMMMIKTLKREDGDGWLSPALRQTFNPPGFGFCSFFGRSG